MNKLILNRSREFGDCIADGFKVLGKNFKAFISGFMIYVFPVIFLTFFLIYGIGAPAMDNFEFDWTSSPIFVIALYGGMILGYLVLCSLVYSIFIAYQDNGNSKINFQDIQPLIIPYFLRILPVYLIVILIYIIPSILLFISLMDPTLGILAFPAMIIMMYLISPMVIAPFIRIYEGLGSMDSIIRAFKIIKGHWWPTFGVIFIASIITMMSTYVLSIPVYIIFLFKSLSGFDATGIDSGTGIWGSVLILMFLFSYLFASSYFLSCSNLKYLDLLERKEGVSLQQKIDSFGTQKDSIFENEGEY